MRCEKTRAHATARNAFFYAFQKNEPTRTPTHVCASARRWMCTPELDTSTTARSTHTYTARVHTDARENRCRLYARLHTKKEIDVPLQRHILFPGKSVLLGLRIFFSFALRLPGMVAERRGSALPRVAADMDLSISRNVSALRKSSLVWWMLAARLVAQLAAEPAP